MINYYLCGFVSGSVSKLIDTVMENISFILISLAMMAGVYLVAFISEKLILKHTGVSFAGNRTKVDKLAIMGMFSALAVVIMYFEFPIPFIAPPFYEMDLSEIPVLVGSFLLGPTAGVVMEAVKILLKLLLKGTSTAFVGDFANFILGCALVVPASVVYHIKKTKKMAVIGLVTGAVVFVISGALLNAWYLLPKYSVLYGIPVESFISMGAKINPSINDVFTFVALAVAPFNIVKAVIVCTITALLYKHVSRLLKGN